MSDQAARIAVMLGLVPMLCAMFVQLLHWELIDADGYLQAVTAVVTAVAVCVSVGLWRRFVAWTFPRASGTAVNTGVLLGHVLIWMPIIDVGCTNDFLILSQQMELVGVWTGVSAAIWWAGAKPYSRKEGGGGAAKRARCNVHPSIARLVAGWGLVPLIPGLYYMLLEIIDELATVNTLCICLVHGCCVLIILATWLWLWRRPVRWTRVRVRNTVVASVVLFVTAVASPFVFEDLLDWDGMWICAPLIVLGVWFWLTAWWWREGPIGSPLTDAQAIAERLRCLDCDYSMVGLHQARCPECGRQYRLEELMAQCIPPAS